METYHTPRGLVVPASAVRVSFARAGGPGGQHVNTSSTKARVVVDVLACGFDEATLDRVIASVGVEVVAVASDERSQWRNRKTALTRALARLDDAAAAPVERVATAPTAGSQRRRLDDKRHRAQRKADRRTPAEGW